jgi:hypothetical protein
MCTMYNVHALMRVSIENVFYSGLYAKSSLTHKVCTNVHEESQMFVYVVHASLKVSLEGAQYDIQIVALFKVLNYGIGSHTLCFSLNTVSEDANVHVLTLYRTEAEFMNVQFR